MLILASTSDKIRLVTASAGSIFVHASWMDNISGAISPGRTNTPEITTATTTDIVAPPGSGVFRAVKTMHIHNNGTGVATVTVIHSDGTTACELHKQMLGPKETLQYIDEVGFRYVNSIGEQGAGGRVLLASITPDDGVASFPIGGPEIWSNPNYDAIEVTALIHQKAGSATDAPAFRVSTDGGATYVGDNGVTNYGYAISAGGGSGNYFGGSGALTYGYIGTPTSLAFGSSFPSTSRFIIYQPWKQGLLKTWIGQAGGWQDNNGGYVYNFWCFLGLGFVNPITHVKFIWVSGVSTFFKGGFVKIYGIK